MDSRRSSLAVRFHSDNREEAADGYLFVWLARCANLLRVFALTRVPPPIQCVRVGTPRSLLRQKAPIPRRQSQPFARRPRL